MASTKPLQSLFAAAITPPHSNAILDTEGLEAYLSFLALEGCHGALLLGITGEGHSFWREERQQILRKPSIEPIAF